MRQGCTNSENYDTCANSQITTETNGISLYRRQQKGWAARTQGDDEFCYSYDQEAKEYKFETRCERHYPFGPATENYVAPASHAIRISLPAAEQIKHAGKTCTWSWAGLEDASVTGTTNAPCAETAILKAIPWPKGARVTAAAEGEQIETNVVVVRDVLIVGLGDSFAAGEGNPDKPVSLSQNQSMMYDPYARGWPIRDMGPGFDPNASDRSLFYAAAAKWVSPNCHRSQYSYQFRVAVQLAVENRKTAVTFVHLACSGAEITDGLFGQQPAREHVSEGKVVRSQLNQLFELLCKGENREFSATLRRPRNYGYAGVEPHEYKVIGCDRSQFRRSVDLVLMTFGGNDVGFSSLVASIMLRNSGDVAPIVKTYETLAHTKLIFGPEIAEGYLDILDGKFVETKSFLEKRLGISASKVVQTGYVSMQRDQNGQLCSGTNGLDVDPKFAFQPSRIDAADRFASKLFARLECIASSSATCGKLSSDPGTGFKLVTDFQPAFVKRGVCAVKDGSDEKKYAAIPQIPVGSKDGAFVPWTPSRFLPYAPRERLALAPNDAMLTANMHEDGASSPPLHDAVQLLYGSLYSGAFHPTAHGQAIIADAVYPAAARIVGMK